MPDHFLKFEKSAIPDIIKGAPQGRGFLFNLSFQGQVLNMLAGESIELSFKVPSNEHWYILQWRVQEDTGGPGLPNLWEALTLWYTLDRFASPLTVEAIPNAGPWTEVSGTANKVPVWNRWWDGATGIQWSDNETSGLVGPLSSFTVRASDPVWSLPRVNPGTIVMVQSQAGSRAGGASSGMALDLVVLRFRTEPEDLKRLLIGSTPGQVALDDEHEFAHRPALSD